MSETTTELQNYTAHCHCNAVRLSFQLAPLDQQTTTIVSCNCSICTRNGYVLIYPRRDTFKVDKGEAELSSYRFASKEKPHRFCRNCGSSMYIDFTEASQERLRSLMAVNLRMVPGFEDLADQLAIQKVDGKTKLLPAYSVTE